MQDTLSISEINQHLHVAETEFCQYCLSISDEQFFYQPPGKWSAAQQVAHLIIAAKTTRLAYTLPKFMIRWIVGKAKRESRTYSQLVDKYKMKLQQGGRASGRFIPKTISSDYGREKLLNEFTKAMTRLQHSIVKNWKEPETDRYIAPHPLLGKITLRELGYFTIHHTYHHLESIRKNVKF